MEKKPFEEVYNSYYKKIYFYLLKKINNSFEAEDLTQEIFVKCYRYYESYDPDVAAVSTWIYTIMNNHLKNYYRDRKQHISLDQEDSLPPLKSEEYLEEACILEEEKKIVLCAIDELSEREQIIIKKTYFEQKNSKEIARMLGITSSNVRVILTRAKEKIKKYFIKQGYEV